MRAREGLLRVAAASATTCEKMLPIIREGGSDTATFDNVLELLVHDRAARCRTRC